MPAVERDEEPPVDEDGPAPDDDGDPPTNEKVQVAKEDGVPAEKGDGDLVAEEDGDPPPDGGGRAEFVVRTPADPNGALANKDDEEYEELMWLHRQGYINEELSTITDKDDHPF